MANRDAENGSGYYEDVDLLELLSRWSKLIIIFSVKYTSNMCMLLMTQKLYSN